MRRSTVRFILAAMVALSMLQGYPAVAQGNSVQTNINSAYPIGGTQLVISGENFGSTQPAVTIDNQPLLVLSHTPNSLVVELPGSVVAAQGGSYHLTVVRGGNGSVANRTGVLDVAIGVSGATGAQGETGVTGPAGPQGVQGDPGATGATGPMGPTGPAGANGSVGPTGPAGSNGAIGPTGPAGLNGVNGLNGAQGATGATGATGPQGPAGTPSLYAAVRSDGIKISGSAGVTTALLRTGVYRVTLPSNVFSCGINVSSSQYLGAGTIGINPDVLDPPGISRFLTVFQDISVANTLVIGQRDSAGVLSSGPFTITVTCP